MFKRNNVGFFIAVLLMLALTGIAGASVSGPQTPDGSVGTELLIREASLTGALRPTAPTTYASSSSTRSAAAFRWAAR